MVHRQGTNDYLVGLIIRGGRSALKTAGPSAELTTTRYNSTPLRWNEIFHCYALNETRHLESTAKPSIRASHPPGIPLACLAWPARFMAAAKGGGNTIGLQISRQRLVRTREPLSCCVTPRAHS
jgi:hypothetical protein